MSLFLPLVIETGWNTRAKNKRERELVLTWIDTLSLKVRIKAVLEVVEDSVLHIRCSYTPRRGLILVRFWIKFFIALRLHFDDVNEFFPSEAKIDRGDVRLAVDNQIDNSVDLLSWAVAGFIKNNLGFVFVRKHFLELCKDFWVNKSSPIKIE